MQLRPIQSRLKTALPGLRQVGGSADMVSAMAGAVAVPAAFVLPMGEVGKDLGLLGQTHQSVAQGFGVLHVVSNRRDAQGSAALDDLEALRTALKLALIGWVPDAATGEPVTFVSGKLVQFDAEGRLWWLDEFLLNTYWSA
ncbi:hypothetical protein [Rhodoferax sp.]|uniref:phage tail terminator protein n=1 Tax=Rhodoferax sp. TaxID=50421 RepID=UPI0026022653|nr:hypothetical protein [Rhodoferax sp.]MDD2809298.1 hypothetical protein [Rhodoferax sp.]MDD4942739.1 hypothetical protein [Rhodoferax sp.]